MKIDDLLRKRKIYRHRATREEIDRQLQLAGFDATVSLNERKTVHAAWNRLVKLFEYLDAEFPDDEWGRFRRPGGR